MLLFIFPFSRSSVCPAYLMITTVVFLSACRNHHTFLSLSNVVFYWAYSSTLTMGGADCAEGHPDTGAEWLTFIVGFAGFQQWLWSVTLHVHMGVHVGASTRRTVHSVNVHPGREFNFTSKPLTKKHGELPHSRLDPTSVSPSIEDSYFQHLYQPLSLPVMRSWYFF